LFTITPNEHASICRDRLTFTAAILFWGKSGGTLFVILLTSSKTVSSFQVIPAIALHIPTFLSEPGFVGFQDLRDLKSGESLNPLNRGSDGFLRLSQSD
jgi:hypothetical protein